MDRRVAKRTYVLKRTGLERLQRGDNPAHSLCLQAIDSIQRDFSKGALLSGFSSVPYKIVAVSA
jgi:hypothetical protein